MTLPRISPGFPKIDPISEPIDAPCKVVSTMASQRLKVVFYCNRWHRYLSNYLHHWKWYDLPALLVYCLVVFRQWYKAILIGCKASGD